jgi:hypothetical protein
LQDEHFSAWGGIFADLVRRGYACHAGRVGNEGQFAHRERWLPHLAWEPPPPDDANVEVMRRFFTSYGPATTQDFAYWRAAVLVQARRWLALLAPELTEVLVEGQPMFMIRTDVEAALTPPPPPEAWPVRLLYRFEPLLLAHKDKTWVADAANYKRIWRPAGHIEGIVLAHGRAVATWRYDRKGQGLVITVSPFGALPRYAQQAIETLAPQVASFFALPLVDLIMESTA